MDTESQLHELIEQVASTGDGAALAAAVLDNGESAGAVVSALRESRDAAILRGESGGSSSNEVEQSAGGVELDALRVREADEFDAEMSAMAEGQRRALADADADAAPPATQQQLATRADAAQRERVAATVAEALGDTTSDGEQLPGDHPLMRRVQEALHAQLAALDRALELELRDKEEAAARAKGAHQQVGVRLYDLQSGLGALRAKFEDSLRAHTVMRQLREEAEAARAGAEAAWAKSGQEARESQRRVQDQRLELDELNRKLGTITGASGALDADVSVAKRGALGLEQQLQGTERHKRAQDHHVHALQQQLLALQARERTFVQQHAAQLGESSHSRKLLAEAEAEMELLRMEKRALGAQWRRSVAHLHRKEEVVRQIGDVVRRDKGTLAVMAGELAGFRKALRRAAEEHGVLSGVLGRTAAQTEAVQAAGAALRAQRDKLAQTATLIERSLERTEAELKTHEREARVLRAAVKAVQAEVLRTQRETREAEDASAERLMEQLLVGQGSKGVLRDRAKLRASIADKAAQLAVAENTLAARRLEIHALAAETQLQRAEVARLDANLADRNRAVEQYDLETHKRNIELTKKQSEVDDLNKKLSVLGARETSESLGPLEATIHNMNKTIAHKEQECIRLQQFWLKTQTELVGLLRKADETADDVEELSMREQVWKRKRIHLNAQFEREEKTIKELQRSLRGLHGEQVKINTMASKHNVAQRQLEENNMELESEFRAKLREAELESIRLEETVSGYYEEKQQCLEGVVEAERQIMQWEKKIQLAKETQAALDPNLGASEHQAMEAEIHRMQLRLAAHQRAQEELIAEMEKAVWRRDGIASKNKSHLGFGPAAAAAGGGSSSSSSSSSNAAKRNHAQDVLKREIGELTRSLKTVLNEIHECDMDVLAVGNVRERISGQIAAARELIRKLADTQLTLLRHYTQLSEDRLVSVQSTQLTYARYKYYTSLGAGGYKPLVAEPAKRTEALQKWQEKNRALVETAAGVSRELRAAPEPEERQVYAQVLDASGLDGLLKAAPILDVLIR